MLLGEALMVLGEAPMRIGEALMLLHLASRLCFEALKTYRVVIIKSKRSGTRLWSHRIVEIY